MISFYLGIDLAWGERNGDGLCLISADSQTASVVSVDYTVGDDALRAWVQERIPSTAAAFVTIDAPLVIVNETGTRPVDRLTHQLFRKQHAACHPANLGKCPRPVRIAKLFGEMGYSLGWDRRLPRQVAEVYPHPAMVRMFELDRIIKYKKGSVVERRKEFIRYQTLLKKHLVRDVPELNLGSDVEKLFVLPWKKPIEDRLDALFCALIGYRHGKYGGLRSEVIGDLETGFILLPKEPVIRAV